MDLTSWFHVDLLAFLYAFNLEKVTICLLPLTASTVVSIDVSSLPIPFMINNIVVCAVKHSNKHWSTSYFCP